MSPFKKIFGKQDCRSDEQHPSELEVFAQLDALRRKAAIAEIGGFRPPDDSLSSWFGGHAVMLPDEAVPEYNGKPMFPLLQINILELPYVPEQLSGTSLLVVLLNQDEIPFDQPNGEGWLIREYTNLEGLRFRPDPAKPSHLKKTIRFSHKILDNPGRERLNGL